MLEHSDQIDSVYVALACCKPLFELLTSADYRSKKWFTRSQKCLPIEVYSSYAGEEIAQARGRELERGGSG